MKNLKVKKIELINVSEEEEREVQVTLSNGTVVHIVPCYESWQQYGGTIDELQVTMPIAEEYNAWLHEWTDD